MSDVASTLETLEDYRHLEDVLEEETDTAAKRVMLRELCQQDLYFLLRYACGRADIEHPWILARCKEVQADPDEHLDLWSREHYKSTLITFGLSIFNILNDPDITIGIFSHNRPIAKGFLRQIKIELQGNELLKTLFPDILWMDPLKEAPKWSEDDGIIVRRSSNPKESTVEAWGLVDSQPTGKHFRVLMYDDVVTVDSVRSPEMMQKTTESLELSYNLGSDGGVRRMAGTRYHFNDTYKTVMDRASFAPRIYPATEDGSIDSSPVLWTAERLHKKRRDMGLYTFNCQILLNPVGDSALGFQRKWIKRFLNRDGAGMNKYILVDPANERKKSSDRTAIAVIGLGSDQNYYLLDLIYDRLSLTERCDHLFAAHQKWRPMRVGYEKYGMQSDIAHIQSVQERRNYRFDVCELGGQMRKTDRIGRLIPLFEQGRFYLPMEIMRTIYDRRTVDVIDQFLCEEYDGFPVAQHDDALDAISRIVDPDLGAVFPYIEPEEEERYRRHRERFSPWAA